MTIIYIVNHTNTFKLIHFYKLFTFQFQSGHQSKEAGIRTLVALDDQGGESRLQNNIDIYYTIFYQVFINVTQNI